MVFDVLAVLLFLTEAPLRGSEAMKAKASLSLVRLGNPAAGFFDGHYSVSINCRFESEVKLTYSTAEAPARSDWAQSSLVRKRGTTSCSAQPAGR